MRIELSKIYNLLSPRVVTLITTVNSLKGVNAAPVDFVSPVSIDPPIVMISLRSTRKTYENIREKREFVINILSRQYADEVLRCAARYPPGINKLEQVGLHSYSSVIVKTPRVKEAKIWIECKLHDERIVGDHVAIFAQVLVAEVKDDIFTDGEVDMIKLNPILHVTQDNFATDFKVTKYKRYD
jgi:flavin reductase (DIM6/NTAB) family NADH-FMN oxidoreductase RutF